MSLKKQCQVNFYGYSSKFGESLECVVKNDSWEARHSLADYFKNIFKTLIKPANKLGEGFHGCVYKIDDDYVLKMHRNYHPDLEHMFLDPLPFDSFKQLKTYYGNFVATLNHGEISIMRNVSHGQEHMEAGVPRLFSAMHVKDECTKYYEEVYLPKFSALPQKSFDDLAKDCRSLNEMPGHHVFDYINPNNFVIVGDKIRVIDEIRTEGRFKTNSVEALLNVFLKYKDLDSVSVYSEKGLPYRRELFKKVVLAGMRENLPPGEFNEWRYVIEDLCRSKIESDKVFKTLENFKLQLLDPDIRVKYAKEFIESMFAD